MKLIADYLAELIKAHLENRVPSSVPVGVTVEEIIRIAGKQHMNYLLLGSLIKADNITQKETEKLRAFVIGSLMQTVSQTNEIKKLQECCEKKKIINQPMKGARLKSIYPLPQMREMSDIDILIRKEDMDKFATELKEMGYSLKQSIKHHDIYIKPHHLVVEAHRAMYDKTVDKTQYQYFLDRSKTQLMEGCQYTYNFNPEDFYIYMLSHMAKHFYVMGCGVRNLVDIYIYRNAYRGKLDETYLNGELERCQILNFTKHMEKLAFIWLDGEKETDFYNDVFDYMLDSGVYGKDENGIWNKFSEKTINSNEEKRFHLAKWYYFPPLYYMVEYYPWLEKKPFLLPAAWMIRGIRGFFMDKGVKKRHMIREINTEKIETLRKIYQEMNLHFDI